MHCSLANLFKIGIGLPLLLLLGELASGRIRPHAFSSRAESLIPSAKLVLAYLLISVEFWSSLFKHTFHEYHVPCYLASFLIISSHVFKKTSM